MWPTTCWMLFVGYRHTIYLYYIYYILTSRCWVISWVALRWLAAHASAALRCVALLTFEMKEKITRIIITITTVFLGPRGGRKRAAPADKVDTLRGGRKGDPQYKVMGELTSMLGARIIEKPNDGFPWFLYKKEHKRGNDIYAALLKNKYATSDYVLSCFNGND